MSKVSVPCYVIDANVIEKVQDKFSEIRFQKVVHEALESEWGITETKWHDQELIMAFMSSKGCLGDVNLLHPYLVVARVEVHLGKKFGTI